MVESNKPSIFNKVLSNLIFYFFLFVDKFIPEIIKKYMTSKYTVDEKNNNFSTGIENFGEKIPNIENVSIQLGDNFFNKKEKIQKNTENNESNLPLFKFLIIDCSSIAFIDSVGVKVIKQVNRKKKEKYYIFFYFNYFKVNS